MGQKLSKRDKLKLYTDDDKIECLVCGVKCLQITGKHTLKHGMTLKQYIEQFPDAKIICDKALEAKSINISKSLVGKPAHNKGTPQSHEHKLKQSEIMKAKFASGEIVHWNTGNTTSQETKDKISSSLIGHTAFNATALEKRNKTIADKVADGWRSPLLGRNLSPEHKAKTLIALANNKNKALIRRTTNIVHKCKDRNLTLIKLDEDNIAHLSCNTCSTSFTFHKQIFDSCKKFTDKICPTCFPRTTGDSNIQKLIHHTIKDNCAGVILYNDRTVLNGKEIDIYLPELKLGFEINGNYWHSELNNGSHLYHTLHKQQHAISEGIRIITIFEDEINDKFDIVKSRILNILNKTPNRIYARKCTIKEINDKIKNDFLLLNHIQGKDFNTECNLGAYYNNELVAVMTFKKTNFVKGGDGSEMELSRFCSKLNTNVVGIASKIFKHYVSTNNVKSVISYADRRWSLGNLYKSIGFTFDGHSKPNYWYMKDYTTRMHRSNFMKHMLKDKLEKFDPSLTEWENMKLNGYDRIWDCGTTKWRILV